MLSLTYFLMLSDGHDCSSGTVGGLRCRDVLQVGLQNCTCGRSLLSLMASNHTDVKMGC
ncbi:hypothetical protein DAI22_08g187400 [Oryza sativa Japonica Group]|nr:hypothetical protein DAI22_08g187400 [Oryza sativa Japonica Group]